MIQVRIEMGQQTQSLIKKNINAFGNHLGGAF